MANVDPDTIPRPNLLRVIFEFPTEFPSTEVTVRSDKGVFTLQHEGFLEMPLGTAQVRCVCDAFAADIYRRSIEGKWKQ